MNLLIKRLSKLLAAVIILLIITVIILLSIIDPNDYKIDIQNQVKKSINRELLINGDIGWTFYPQLGFSSGEIELNNPTGFNRQYLIKIESATIALNVMPLLKGEIKLGKLTINGLVVNLITNKDGRSNLDNMLPSGAEIKEEEQVQEKQIENEDNFFALDKAELAGIEINNTIIEIQDLQLGSNSKIEFNSIKLGHFVLGERTDFSIITDFVINELKGHIELQSKLTVAPDFSSVQLNKFNLKTALTGKALPNGKISSLIKSNIFYNLNNSETNINNLLLLVDKLQLKGKLKLQTGDKTKVRFTLLGNHWDLNPYLNSSSSEKQVSQPTEQTTSEQEPDLSFLHNLDVQGTLTIAGIKTNKVQIGKTDLTLIINHGKAQIKPLTAQLYDGLLTVNGWVDDAQGKNRYKTAVKLNGVQLKPLLNDLAQTNLLSGTTSFNFFATGKGLTSSKIKTDLLADGDFKLLDGELYGVNIPQEIRALKAKLTGKPAPTEDNIKKTDFASLTGEFEIEKGVVNNRKLLMLSPVMRLDGLGLINIIKESLDYKLSITALSKSDAETNYVDLSGLTIPLLIQGSFADPKFTLDTDGALKERLKAKAKNLHKKAKAEFKKQQEALQGKSKEELSDEAKKLKEKMNKELKKLFG